MNHDPHPGEPDELAALYLAGALTPDEARAFEAHLDSGCAACRAALRDLDRAADALVGAVAPIPPDPATRDRLLRRIAPPQAPEPEPFVLRADAGEWTPTRWEGVALRTLGVYRDQGHYTAILRMEPGAKIPDHVHDCPEELFILTGDLRAGDSVFAPGDYQRYPAGSRHGDLTSLRGCTALVVKSLAGSSLLNVAR
jgi:hypothetical protein